MTFTRLIRRALWGWQAWKMRRELERAMPELRDLRQRREQCRKQHKCGSAEIERKQRARINAALAGRV